MSNSKRTRSQLALPDFDFQQLGRSPLKDARIATRHNQYSGHSLATTTEGQVIFLPSEPNLKHSGSPLKGSPISERAPKRVKYEDTRIENRSPGHQKRSSTPSHSHLPPTSPITPKRSRSAPLSSSIPHIDLVQLPRSPSKSTAALRIASVAPLIDQDVSPYKRIVPVIQETVPDNVSSLATPKKTSSPLLALSPLTPLPKTPAPVTNARLDRYEPVPPVSSENHTINQNGAAPGSLAVPVQRPSTSSSRLPRPSMASILLSPKDIGTQLPSRRGKQSRQKNANTSRLAPLGGRMTRSASLRQRQAREKGAPSHGLSGESTAPSVQPLSHWIISSATAPTEPVASSSVSDSNSARDIAGTRHVSYVRRPTSFSFAQTTASSAAKSNIPSPIKRRVPPFSIAPSHVTIDSSFNSSLSSLSNALEKLNMPPPPRPSTSMGFQPEDRDANRVLDKQTGEKSQTRDDTIVGRAGDGLAENFTHKTNMRETSTLPLKKAATLSDLSKLSSRPPHQRSLMLPPPTTTPSGGTSRINIHSGIVTGKIRGSFGLGRPNAVPSGSSTHASARPHVFGVGALVRGVQSGGRVLHKASKKTSLPMVEGSPVKGKSGVAPHEHANTETAQAVTDSDEHTSTAPSLERLEAIQPSEREITADHPTHEASQDTASLVRKQDASRRASLASHLVSQHFSPLPITPVPSVGAESDMPMTLPNKGKDVVGVSTTEDLAPEPLTHSRSAPGALTRSMRHGSHVYGRRAVENMVGPGESPSNAPRQLEVLRDSVIFVDVRTDDGDDASALFVDMLKGMGAKILARVGQTCTHIVYKNGLMSTITRYRLLKEPRPLVVGIAWVVECAEQRAHLDETRFAVNLENENVAGINKRRKSMLPKQLQSATPANPLSSELDANPRSSSPPAAADVSNSAPDHSKDATVAPLEKARRRQSILFSA